MHDGVDQTQAWKDTQGTDTEHPAGDVRPPMSRGHVARAMVLAGMVVGMGVVAELAGPGTTTGP
jgi:hypothetical protein